MTPQAAVILRALRGAPLSVLIALALHGPAGRDELSQITGYSANAVSSALSALEAMAAITRQHYRTWCINPGWNQLPLPTPNAASYPQSYPQAAPAVLPSPTPAAESAENALSAANQPAAPPNAAPPAPASPPAESAKIAPSAAESAKTALSGLVLDGDPIDIDPAPAPAPPKPNHPNPRSYPIERDQTSPLDPDIIRACQRYGIAGRARALIAGSAHVQALGPGYVANHISRAARDPNRTGGVVGLAIHRIFQLQPALPCGDCRRCNACRHAYGNPPLPAEYADIVKR